MSIGTTRKRNHRERTGRTWVPIGLVAGSQGTKRPAHPGDTKRPRGWPKTLLLIFPLRGTFSVPSSASDHTRSLFNDGGGKSRWDRYHTGKLCQEDFLHARPRRFQSICAERLYFLGRLANRSRWKFMAYCSVWRFRKGSIEPPTGLEASDNSAQCIARSCGPLPRPPRPRCGNAHRRKHEH